MSTKTSFKRIAAVAAVALTLGGFSAVSAHAAASASLGLNATSFTLVSSDGSGYVVAEVSPFDASGNNQALQSGEKIQATVLTHPTAVDTSTANSDITLGWAATATQTNGTLTIATYGAGAPLTATTNKVTQADNTTGTAIDLHLLRGGSTATTVSTYLLGIKAASGKALDKGTYTIGLYLLDSNNNVLSTKTISFSLVSNKIYAGAVLTAAAAGTGTVSTTFTGTKYNNVTASLRDANGGLIREGSNAAPSVSASALDSAGATTGTSWNAKDDGATGYEGTSLTALDGNYDVSSSAALTATAGTTTVTVRYGTASATASLTVLAAGTGTVSNQTVTAVGASALTAPWTSGAYAQWVPLTTTSAVASWSGATPGVAYPVTVVWNGGTNTAGDLSPTSGAPAIVYADASGKVSVTVTDAVPTSGTIATATITGLTSAGTIAVKWIKSQPANISVSNNGAVVALKSTNTFTATVTDNFGVPVAGVALQPVVSGSNADATARPSVLTNASGEASITLTDAAAVAAGTDTVTFTDSTALVNSGNSATVTYAAATPANTALTAYYSTAASTATGSAVSTVVPATGVYADASGTNFGIVIGRDNSKPIAKVNQTFTGSTANSNSDQLAIRIVGTAAGVPVTATASTGAYVLNSSNVETASRTQYTAATTFDATWVAGSNVAGANTITFTSGTVTTTVTFYEKTVAANTRFVTLSQSGSVVTAKTTDRYGNPTSGVTVQISTNAGTLGNGQLTTVYTTDSTGSVTFAPVGASTANITATVTSTGTDIASIAGYVGSTSVDSTLAAGNATTTLAATGGTSATDAASAATDAANEATDAANAATDAANAAADAADAATSAAQDASDQAQAALAAVNALSAKITVLAAQIAKIVKKLKA
jgi:trimeric autotransporter adhesin